MLPLYLRMSTFLAGAVSDVMAKARTRLARQAEEEGQATAEYALVILAAAAVALVLIAWARSSGKLPAFFDKIIDDVTGSAE